MNNVMSPKTMRQWRSGRLHRERILKRSCQAIGDPTKNRGRRDVKAAVSFIQRYAAAIYCPWPASVNFTFPLTRDSETMPGDVAIETPEGWRLQRPRGMASFFVSDPVKAPKKGVYPEFVGPTNTWAWKSC